VPQITHRDLVALADDRVNLRKSEVDDQRAQVNPASRVRVCVRWIRDPSQANHMTLLSGDPSRRTVTYYHAHVRSSPDR
jgi:hypothetical protein